MHYICTSLPQPYTSPCESSSATSLSSSSSSPSSRPNRLHLPLHLPLDDNTNECRHHRGPGHCTRRHIRRSITARRATPASRRCPSSESASTLSEEDDSVMRTAIPRRPDPNTPSSSSISRYYGIAQNLFFGALSVLPPPFFPNPGNLRSWFLAFFYLFHFYQRCARTRMLPFLPEVTMPTVESIKVVLLGDSGVGKSR